MDMIIAVSDVHLGFERSNSECFMEFISQCATVELEHFVILGDLMDFWRANNAEVMIKYQDILGTIGRLKAKNVYYIPGNHDFFVHKLAAMYPDYYPFKVVNRLRLSDGGSVINFTHGYELEVLANLEPLTIETYERLSERMCFTERITGGIASQLWEWIENRNERREKADYMRRPAHERAWDRVHELAVSRGAYVMLGMSPDDKLVYGHTHRAFITRDSRVANTGAWVSDLPEGLPQNTYVTVIDGRMELKTFGKDRFP